MTPDELSIKGEMLRDFSNALQPVIKLPTHIKEVRGFAEYRPLGDIIEITLFWRPAFLKVSFDDGATKISPKFRMDVEMKAEDFFEEHNYDRLRNFLLNIIYSFTAEDILEIPEVKSVTYIYDVKIALASTTHYASLSRLEATHG